MQYIPNPIKRRAEKGGKRTVTFSNSMMKRREALAVGRVEGAPVAQEERHHGHGADGGGAVDGVLAAAVADAGRCRRVGGEEEAGDVEVLFGGDEVEGGLEGWLC